MLPFLPGALISDSVDQLAEDEVVYFVQEQPIDGQIVDLNDDLSSDLPPDESKYFSTKDRRVDQQSQAKNTGPQVPKQRQFETKEDQQQQKSDDSQFDQSKYGQRPKPKLNTDLPQEFLANLTPSSPSNYLPNIDYGDQTLLNTREYAYAHFFVRMKRQMELVWNPRRILRTNTRDFRPEYRTVVSIVLDKSGKVRQVKVVSSSTLVDLDREALRAVRKAGPYLNPPKELVDANGQIRINEWHFIINQQASLF
jgi:TonB family protein